MPRYIQAVLHRFQHSPPTRKEHASHSWERPNYVATQKFTKVEDTFQNIIFSIENHRDTIFYAKAIYLKMLFAMGKIAASKTSGTIET